MNEKFNTTTPIYLQLVERINRQIISGQLRPGDKLPSVREMAVQAGVNPNTVQRTYRELELSGVVETRRGQGTFVTDKEEVLQTLRARMRKERILSFVKDMQEMGYSPEEILEGIRDYLTIREEKATLKEEKQDDQL